MIEACSRLTNDYMVSAYLPNFWALKQKSVKNVRFTNCISSYNELISNY